MVSTEYLVVPRAVAYEVKTWHPANMWTLFKVVLLGFTALFREKMARVAGGEPAKKRLGLGLGLGLGLAARMRWIH